MLENLIKRHCWCRFFSRLPLRQYRCIATGGQTNERSQDVGNRTDRGRALGLMYGGFTYTKDTHEAKLGPIELSIKDRETVNVPVWAGVGTIVAGVILLFVRK